MNLFYSKSIFYLLIILLLPASINIINFYFGFYYLDDSLTYFQTYKFLNDYFLEFKKFPLWVEGIHYGLNSSFIFRTIGVIGTFFAILSGFFEINAYYSFIILVSFYNSIFLYGIYLNIKKNIKLYFFLIIIVLYLSSNINLISLGNDALYIMSVPYINYFIYRYFKTFKFIHLNKLIACIAIMFFIMQSYLIVPILYFTIINFLLYFIFYNNNHGGIKGTLKKIFLNISLLNLTLFLSIILSFIIYNWSVDYISNYTIRPPFRGFDGNQLKVTFDTFRFYGKTSFNLNFETFINGNINYETILFSYSSIGLISFIYFFIRCKKILLNKSILIKFILINLFLLIAISNYEPIDYFVYNLPFFDYFRHKSHLVNFIYPIFLLLIYKIIQTIINDTKFYNKVKKYLILIMVALYSLSIYKNSTNFINLLIIISQICIAFSFLRLLSVKKNQNIYTLMIIFFLFLVGFINNKESQLKLDRANLLYEQIHIQNKIDFKKKNYLKCISKEKYINKYNDLIDPENFRGHILNSYGQIILLTTDYPCTPTLRFWYWNNWNIWESSVNNPKLSFNKNFTLKKINNQKYEITKNNYEHVDYKGLIKIAWDKNWKLVDNNIQKQSLLNKNGFLLVDHISKSNKVILIYTNNLLDFYIFTQLIIGLIITAFFFLVVLKKFRTKS
jgi:hypothetical protein